jgi:hypothetical protein
MKMVSLSATVHSASSRRLNDDPDAIGAARGGGEGVTLRPKLYVE